MVLAVLASFQAAPAQRFFTAPGPPDSMRGKQAVMETTAGTIIIELLPDAAPNQVALFMKMAADGSYVGTVFHRVVRFGVVQGGDLQSKDPSKATLYGSGGWGQVKLESSTQKHVAGALSAVRLPNQPDSAGTQFFICVSDQPGLDGQHTVFGRVVDGLEIAQAISSVATDPQGHPLARVEIKSIAIRDTPPEPFVSATVSELAQYKAILETSMGTIEMEMLPDKAPETVRAFLRMADAGIYDGIKVHRVARNFVIQTGSLVHRAEPLRIAQQRLVHDLKAEFTNTPNLPGIVSMARGDSPDSATTSFFICIGDCRSLDNKYTVFAKVTAGMTIVSAMGNVPIDDETPRTTIMVKKVRVEKKP